MLREDRYKKKMGLGQDGNSLVLLLAILAVLFCLFQFMLLVYRLSNLDPAAYYKNIYNWFSLPAGFEKMMTRPWTIITNIFVHDSVMHMLGNLLWLWAFGYILQDLAGNSKLIPLFIYGGIAGSITYLACYNIIPRLVQVAPSSFLDGASAGVTAIVIATTALAPDYRIFPMINGGIPLWVLAVIYVIVDLASAAGGKGAEEVSHLGGAAMGFIFVLRLRKGSDWSIWMNNFFNWATNLFNPDKKNWKKTARHELHYKSKGTQPYKKVPNITQKRIDEILDKINQQGYRFLTDEEKDILKRASEDEEL